MINIRYLVRYSGPIVFFVSVLMVLGFAQGYVYDFKQHKLVKKAAVELPLPPDSNGILSVDGIPTEYASKAVVRVLPGVHELAFHAEGYLTWKAQFAIEEDQLIRLTDVHLVPQKQALMAMLIDSLPKIFPSTSL